MMRFYSYTVPTSPPPLIAGVLERAESVSPQLKGDLGSAPRISSESSTPKATVESSGEKKLPKWMKLGQSSQSPRAQSML